MTASTLAAGDRAVRTPRPHPTYRRTAGRTVAFRPGGQTRGRGTEAGSHRVPPAQIRCGDPRITARAAAVRRRHILLVAVALALVLLLASPWSGRGQTGLTAPGPTPVASALSPHSVYVVQPGDTLWSIAERLDPQGDPRPAMTAMSNEIGHDTVRPGERLLLP